MGDVIAIDFTRRKASVKPDRLAAARALNAAARELLPERFRRESVKPPAGDPEARFAAADAVLDASLRRLWPERQGVGSSGVGGTDAPADDPITRCRAHDAAAVTLLRRLWPDEYARMDSARARMDSARAALADLFPLDHPLDRPRTDPS